MKLLKWLSPALFKKAIDKYTQEDMPIYAGYATLFILMASIPLLMLVIAVINVMPWFSPVEFVDTLFTVLPDLPEVKNMIYAVVRNLNAQSTGALVSVTAIIVLWSASAGMTAIQRGLQKVSAGSVSGRSDKLKALLYTFLFVLVVLALLVFGVLGESIERMLFRIAAQFKIPFLTKYIILIMNTSEAITLIGVIFVIALMYRYLPGGRRTMKHQIPGAALATVLWIVFTLLFGIIISRFWGSSAIYGSLAAVFLITLWLRFIISILFLGASYNQAAEEELAWVGERATAVRAKGAPAEEVPAPAMPADAPASGASAASIAPDALVADAPEAAPAAADTSDAVIASDAARAAKSAQTAAPAEPTAAAPAARTAQSELNTVLQIGIGFAIMGILGTIGYMRQKNI